jgi:O-antigen/teichoic acid export membrane protein
MTEAPDRSAADARADAGKHIYRRILQNSAVLAGGTIAAALFTMLAVALSARTLSARDFGIFVLLQSAALLVRALASFSTQQPVIKLGSDAQADNDNNRLGNVIAMALVVDIGASVIAFAVAALLIGFGWGLVGLEGTDVAPAWIFAASLLLSGYTTSNGLYRLFNRFGVFSGIQVASAAGLLATSAILYAKDAGLQGFAWAWAAYLAFNSQAQLWVALILVRPHGVPLRFPARSFRSEDGRTLLHYCWTTWGTSTADTIRADGDSLLVGAIVSVESAGVYKVAKQLAGIFRKLNAIVPATVFPEVTRLAAQRNAAGAHVLKSRMIFVSCAIGAGAVGAAVLIGQPLLGIIFGPGFSGAYVPLVVLTGAAAAQLVSHTQSMYVQVFCGPKRLLLLISLTTLAFVAAAVPLTFGFSITGMAAAQLLFPLMFIGLSEVALRRSKNSALA